MISKQQQTNNSTKLNSVYLFGAYSQHMSSPGNLKGK